MISIKVENLDVIQRGFARGAVEMAPLIKDGLIEAGTEIVKTERGEAPHDTGNLQRQIGFEFQPFKISVTPNANYSAPVHEGSRPHMPPVEALKSWAKKRGINPWALARSMEKKGTKANPFVTRTAEKIEDKINKIFQKIAEKAIEILSGK